MNNMARAFDAQTNRQIMPRIPTEQDNQAVPWEITAEGSMPLMMFQLCFHDDSIRSFAYSDLREIDSPHAGQIKLLLQSMGKLMITIEGRHLRDLAGWFSAGKVQSIREADPRDFNSQESQPEITHITVEELVS